MMSKRNKLFGIRARRQISKSANLAPLYSVGVRCLLFGVKIQPPEVSLANRSFQLTSTSHMHKLLLHIFGSICFKNTSMKVSGSKSLRQLQTKLFRGKLPYIHEEIIALNPFKPYFWIKFATVVNCNLVSFSELRKKYGSPLIVMNLVKRREKRRHEALLHDQFLKVVWAFYTNKKCAAYEDCVCCVVNAFKFGRKCLSSLRGYTSCLYFWPELVLL